jgi:hypothetical protein
MEEVRRGLGCCAEEAKSAIGRKFRDVQELPAVEVTALLLDSVLEEEIDVAEAEVPEEQEVGV